MSLLDLASLVLAPTATKEGKVYSAIPDTGEGDMTFTRGSSATRVNSEGLIEKERANLLLQSNSFDTTWLNQLGTGGTITGGQAGYDGSNDAWSISKDTSTFRSVRQIISSSGVQTFSVYVKSGTLTKASLRVDAASTIIVDFDLSTGAFISSSGTYIGYQIDSVGSGWYRISVTYNSSNSNVHIYVDRTGTTSGSILIQDAMLNEGLVAQPYIETTTTAVYEGITDDVPRVDYSGGGCPSLLLEGQRTNLVTQSEYFGASSWTKTNGTVSISNEISPEGKLNAYKFTESTGTINPAIRQNLGASTTTDVTLSVFAKSNGRNYLYLALTGSDAIIFDISNGTIGTTLGTIDSYAITDMGNGWYRCSATKLTNQRDANFGPKATNSFGTYTGDGVSGVYIYGAMLEAGSYVSSYINSYGTSTTRVQDSCSKTGISELIGQTEGTFYVETKSIANDGTFKQIAFDDGTTSNLITIDYTSTDNQLRSFIRDGGTAYSMTATITDSTTFNKIAIKAKDNDFAMWVNGTEVATSETATYPNNLANIEFDNGSGGGLFYGNVKQMILFPTALTDTQLEELTK